MKLYEPVSITSAEQANALPGGTFVRLSLMSDSWTRLLLDREPFEDNNFPSIALVPIEAKKETAVLTGIGNSVPTNFTEDQLDSMPRHTRYVTPWEQV